MTTSNFAALGLSEGLLRALAGAGYDRPTAIQSEAIPALLEGRDLLGIAQTGTGKTAAFMLPILQQLQAEGRRALPGSARALILAPTRELASQIFEAARVYGRNSGLTQTVIMGGVGQGAQIRAVRPGVDILIATPGRLLDLVEQRRIDLSRTSRLVLDEADRMLDMGFIRDVRKLISFLPPSRQSMLFSATMPREIASLASDILRNPLRVEIASRSVAVERIEQRVYHVGNSEKRRLLVDLLKDSALARVIVFTRTKHGADRVAKHLIAEGVKAAAIHGNKSQPARETALAAFRSGRARVLVATDIASRGLDVDDVSHVINFELPLDPESYVHRIGRTARAGRDGIAISFCDPNERGQLGEIERLVRLNLAVVGEGPRRGGEDFASRRQMGRPSRTKAFAQRGRSAGGSRRRAA